MSAALASDRYEFHVDRSQAVHARVAGFLFLFTMAAAIVGEVVPSAIRGDGDFGAVAARVVASEQLYRLALLGTAFTALGVLALAHALYVTLEPVNRRLAQLALWARLAEAILIGAALMFRFAALRLYAAAEVPAGFVNEQLSVLVSFTGEAYVSGLHIWLLFWALGSTLFFWLFYRSGYIPRALAGFGVFASIVGLMVSLGSLVFPDHAGTLQYGWATSFVAEVTTGFWLMLRGIRPSPTSAFGPAAAS